MAQVKAAARLWWICERCGRTATTSGKVRQGACHFTERTHDDNGNLRKRDLVGSHKWRRMSDRLNKDPRVVIELEGVD